MNFTQEQISDILFELANKGGTHGAYGRPIFVL